MRHAALRDESGQASASSSLGSMVWILLVAVIVWQVCLVAWTFNQASNAARTASRVEGRGGDAREGGANALPDGAAQDRAADQDPRARRRRCERADPDLSCPGSRRRRAGRARALRSSQADGPADRIASEPPRRAPTTARRRRRLLPPAAARGGQPLRDRRAVLEPQRRARLERVVGRMVSREGPVLSTAERARLIRRVIDEAIGLGVLEPLLADPIGHRDHGQRARRGLRRARRPPRARRHLLHRRGASSTRRSTASSRRSTAASTSRARWSTRACPPASAST